MAVGDVVSIAQSVLASGWLALRPAAGEVYLVYMVGTDNFIGTSPNVSQNVNVFITDGVTDSEIYNAAGAQGFFRQKIPISHDVWLKIINLSASTQALSIIALQIK